MITWKDIKGYEGLYQINSLGQVKSVRRNILLKGFLNNKGYWVVDLCKDAEVRHFLIHRLVAEAFLPNPDNKLEVDHINTICTDNRVENLRWCSHLENMNNSLTLKNLKESKQNRAVLQYDLEGNFISEFISGREAARLTGTQLASLVRCLNKKQHTAGGFKWKFKDD